MDSYQAKLSNSFSGVVAYGSRTNKKMLQSQLETSVIFERTMVKIGFTAVTFPTIDGAKKMLEALYNLADNNFIEPFNAIVVEKNKQGQLKVKKTSSQTKGAPKCSELGFVVGLLFQGSVADDLLGGAAGTLLAHHIELGIAQEKIDRIVGDVVAESSVLFVLDYPGLKDISPAALNQNNGRRYDFSLTEKVWQDVKIMSSTLDHYWLEK